MNNNNGQTSFGALLHASFKSEDTEEWLDVHFTRPIGLAFALLWKRLGVHPNAITVLSIFLGAAAGYMFYFTDLCHNLTGVALLMLANFCDSTDGQLARLTGKKTLVGRVLDGFAGDVWFFCIYLALLLRLGRDWEPQLGAWAYVASFALCAIAGLICHSRQSSLADYYRQIHLYFLLGRKGSELDNYASQRAIYEQLPKSDWLARAFYYNYANYCRSQEQRTPAFQQFISKLHGRWAGIDDVPQPLRDEFRRGSLPLMKYTNLLTFNARAITLYVACCLNVPYVYPFVEIIVFALMYWHMHRSHEALCRRLTQEMD
ncbi:MAG: CDP-alcohol phosphatidyltransferase family protein [Prevotella sp.]|nr:CDP-alcohol phosphatidyltransferase family protein [Prevotella sp.]